MNSIEYIASILKQEGVEWMACFPSNPLIEAVAKEGIRPVGFRDCAIENALALSPCNRKPVRKTPSVGYRRRLPITFPSSFYPAETLSTCSLSVLISLQHGPGNRW